MYYTIYIFKWKVHNKKNLQKRETKRKLRRRSGAYIYVYLESGTDREIDERVSLHCVCDRWHWFRHSLRATINYAPIQINGEIYRRDARWAAVWISAMHLRWCLPCENKYNFWAQTTETDRITNSKCNARYGLGHGCMKLCRTSARSLAFAPTWAWAIVWSAWRRGAVPLYDVRTYYK